MLNFKDIKYWRFRRLALSGGLVVLLLMLLPAQLLADGPVGAEPCAECHQGETDAWQDSPHAKTGVTESGIVGATCEDCHGQYAEGHPEADLMQLKVGSTVCESCHTGTFEQWEHSQHAQAGVQCTSCHLSHSQTFRLTDEALCSACHRDQREHFAYTAHGQAGVACIDCHLSSTAPAASASLSQSGQISRTVPAPSHDFTAVSLAECMACHGEDIHTWSPKTEARAANAEMLAMAERVPELTAKLETAEQTNKSLLAMTPVSLGLGLGIGGMLGIVAVLVIGHFLRRTP
jgi:hypothetical protein